jgi:hypothetical protein
MHSGDDACRAGPLCSPTDARRYPDVSISHASISHASMGRPKCEPRSANDPASQVPRTGQWKATANLRTANPAGYAISQCVPQDTAKFCRFHRMNFPPMRAARPKNVMSNGGRRMKLRACSRESSTLPGVIRELLRPPHRRRITFSFRRGHKQTSFLPHPAGRENHLRGRIRYEAGRAASLHRPGTLGQRAASAGLAPEAV